MKLDSADDGVVSFVDYDERAKIVAIRAELHGLYETHGAFTDTSLTLSYVTVITTERRPDVSPPEMHLITIAELNEVPNVITLITSCLTRIILVYLDDNSLPAMPLLVIWIGGIRDIDSDSVAFREPSRHR